MKFIEMYRRILAICVDPRPKIRKQAQSCIHSLFLHENGQILGSQLSKISNKFFNSNFQQISNCLNRSTTDSVPKNDFSPKILFYLVSLISPIFQCFPFSVLNVFYEYLIHVLHHPSSPSLFDSPSSSSLSSSIFHSFLSLFSFRPSLLPDSALLYVFSFSLPSFFFFYFLSFILFPFPFPFPFPFAYCLLFPFSILFLFASLLLPLVYCFPFPFPFAYSLPFPFPFPFPFAYCLPSPFPFPLSPFPFPFAYCLPFPLFLAFLPVRPLWVPCCSTPALYHSASFHCFFPFHF